ncbi:MAG: chromate transporter [Clostridiales bacterium]|nr:chromate transporter [Clostridiales bacterium]
MIYLILFWEFFQIGLFAVGGGLATLPFLSELGSRRGWFNENDLADMLAISESTPGPIGVNMATYVGYEQGGILGGLVATLGMVTPCLVIILFVAKFLQKYRESRIVNDLFYGLRPASLGLIAAAGFGVWLLTFVPMGITGGLLGTLAAVEWKSVVLAVLLYFLIKKTKKSPILFIVLSGIIGATVFPLLEGLGL